MKISNLGHILSVAFAIGFTSVVAHAASTPTITQANAVCNATLYNFVDVPEPVVFGASGSYRIIFTPSDTVDVGNCRHLYFEIASGTATGYSVTMGKISNATLAETVLTGSSLNHIVSLEIKAPQFVVDLQGPPNTKGTVQMWFYLTN